MGQELVIAVLLRVLAREKRRPDVAASVAAKRHSIAAAPGYGARLAALGSAHVLGAAAAVKRHLGIGPEHVAELQRNITYETLTELRVIADEVIAEFDGARG